MAFKPEYYESRFNDLYDYLQHNIGITDQQALAILVSTHLPIVDSTGANRDIPYPWVVLETDTWSNPLYAPWFTFGITQEKLEVCDFAFIRTNRTSKQNAIADHWRSKRMNRVCMVDTGYLSHSAPMERSNYWGLYRLALRLRLQAANIRPPSQYDLTEIKTLYNRCTGDFCIGRSRWELPVIMAHQLRTAMKLNPKLSSWTDAYWNLAGVVSGVAALHGRRTPMREDLLAGWRVMRDSIGFWTWKYIQAMGERQMDNRWAKPTQIMQKTGLESRDFNKITRTLHENGVIERKGGYLRIVDSTVMDMVDGRAAEAYASMLV